MPIHIANFYEADRRTAVAGENMTQGMVVKIDQSASGERRLYKLLNTDSAELVAANYAVVAKFSVDPDQVESTTAPSPTRDRTTVNVLSGDMVVEVRRGSIIEFSADLLHSSLDPARSGATPAATDTLAIKDSLFCKTDVASAITSPVVARVYKVYGTAVLVELV